MSSSEAGFRAIHALHTTTRSPSVKTHSPAQYSPNMQGEINKPHDLSSSSLLVLRTIMQLHNYCSRKVHVRTASRWLSPHAKQGDDGAGLVRGSWEEDICMHAAGIGIHSYSWLLMTGYCNIHPVQVDSLKH